MIYSKVNYFFKTNIDVIFKVSLCLISLFPLFPRIYGSLSMILFFLVSILFFFNEKKNITFKEIKTFVVLSSLFFIYLISSIYSSNNGESIKFIQLALPLVMFPMSIILFTNKSLGNGLIKIIKRCFVFSLLISTIIINLKLGFLSVEEITQWEFRNQFEKIKGVHGTYYSLWLGFSSLILVKELPKKCKRLLDFCKSFIIVLIIMYFIYWQITLQARLPLFITTLLILIVFINLIRSKIYRYLIYTVIFGFSIILINKESIKSKINFNLPEGRYDLKHLEISSEQIRAGIYFCSFEIFKDNYLFGTGVGDVNSDLNNCYLEKINSNVYQIFHYNTHNQYVQVILSGGIIALLFFIYNICFLIKKAIKLNDSLYIMFLIIILICFLTENILSRHDGVIFFSLFNTIFYKFGSKN